MSEKKQKTEEKITLDEKYREKWEIFRRQTISDLIQQLVNIGDIKRPHDVGYFLETGVSRAFDQRFASADRKMVALTTRDFQVSLDDLIPKGSEKQQLVRELSAKQSILSREMLKKLSLDALKQLKDKL